MMQRFSPQQLHRVRNQIPIDRLIEEVLMLPAKRTDGYFRFACPVCREFNTATHPESNLARCFGCNKNFNTIDIVMIHRKLSFVESVKFLNRCYDFPERTSAHCRTTTPTSCHEIRGTKHPVAIGRIVEKILSDKAPKVLSSDVDIPSSSQPDLVRMLVRLEQKIESLSQRVTEIHNMVTLR